MPLYEHVYLARQDLSAQQVEELTAQLSGVIGAAGRQGHQERILGPEVPHLPHAQEPQGAHDAAQRRCAAGGAQRDRAPGAPQRRRAALSHHPRRRARGRPLGDDAQIRPATATTAAIAAIAATAAIAAAAGRAATKAATMPTPTPSQRWRNRPWHSVIASRRRPPSVLPPSQDLPVLRRQRAEDRLQGRQAVAALRVGARQDRAEPHHRGVGQEAARTRAGDQTRAVPRPAALRD